MQSHDLMGAMPGHFWSAQQTPNGGALLTIIRRVDLHRSMHVASLLLNPEIGALKVDAVDRMADTICRQLDERKVSA